MEATFATETTAAEVHATKIECIAMRSTLIEMETQMRVMVEFIDTLKQVLESMSGNPMLRAMGMGQLKMPQLPGMPVD